MRYSDRKPYLPSIQPLSLEASIEESIGVVAALVHAKVEAIEQFPGFATKIKFSRDSWSHKREDHVKKIHSRRVKGFGVVCAHMSKYLLEVVIEIRLNINSKHFNFT